MYANIGLEWTEMYITINKMNKTIKYSASEYLKYLHINGLL